MLQESSGVGLNSARPAASCAHMGEQMCANMLHQTLRGDTTGGCVGGDSMSDKSFDLC